MKRKVFGLWVLAGVVIVAGSVALVICFKGLFTTNSTGGDRNTAKLEQDLKTTTLRDFPLQDYLPAKDDPDVDAPTRGALEVIGELRSDGGWHFLVQQDDGGTTKRQVRLVCVRTLRVQVQELPDFPSSVRLLPEGTQQPMWSGLLARRSEMGTPQGLTKIEEIKDLFKSLAALETALQFNPAGGMSPPLAPLLAPAILRHKVEAAEPDRALDDGGREFTIRLESPAFNVVLEHAKGDRWVIRKVTRA